MAAVGGQGFFRGLTKTFFLSLFLGIGGFLYGYDSGIITPTLVLPQFVAYFNSPPANLRGAIVSVYQAGAWLGSASVGFTSDRFGRRRGIAFGCAFGVLGGILMSAAAHVAMLIMGRLCVGYAVGTITGISPVYGAEIAKTHERARATAVTQMMVAWGFFVANWTGYGAKFLGNTAQFRLGFAIQALPALALMIGVVFMPESPRWLLMKGRATEAQKSFRRLHGGWADEHWLQEEFSQIQDGVNAELAAEKDASWGEMLHRPSFRKRLFVGCFVWAAAMLSGISFVQYYQPFVYASLNYDTDTQLLITGLYSSIAPIACIAALFIVDRVGRRKILVTSSSLLCASYCVITALSAIYDPTKVKSGLIPLNANALRAVVAMIFLVSANYSGLLGPVTWIIPPEVFTTQMRAKANSVVQVLHYSISLVITQCSPIALERIAWRYYILFCITNGACALVFLFFYPETRGRSLEEMSELFGDDQLHKDIGSSIHEEKDFAVNVTETSKDKPIRDIPI